MAIATTDWVHSQVSLTFHNMQRGNSLYQPTICTTKFICTVPEMKILIFQFWINLSQRLNLFIYPGCMGKKTYLIPSLCQDMYFALLALAKSFEL